jgi:type II secretory pathway pseudopilin PulG
MKRYYIFFAIIFILSAVMTGNQIMISHRARQDTIAEADLRVIDDSIHSHAEKKNSLPEKLSDLTDLCDSGSSVSRVQSRGLFSTSIDSSSKDNCVTNRLTKYTYNKKSYNQFELCADFMTDTKTGSYKPQIEDYYADYHTHDKGHQCFTQTETSITQPLANVSQVVIPSITQNYATKVCGIGYAAKDIYKLVSIDLTTGSVSYEPVSGSKTITVKQFTGLPYSFDANCKALSVNDFKAGDIISVYYSSASKDMVTVVQKQ